MVIPYESELSTSEADVVRCYAEVVDRAGRLAEAVEVGDWEWAQNLSAAFAHTLRAFAGAAAGLVTEAERASDVADVAVIAARASLGGRRLHPCAPLDEAAVSALVRAAVQGPAPADIGPTRD